MNSLDPYGSSIVLYLVCYLLTIALAGLAQIFSRESRPARLISSLTQTSRPSRLFWILSLLVPLLLSSFRWDVGTDYPTYINLYYSFDQIDTFSKFIGQFAITEPSYILLNFLAKAVFNSYVIVFALSSLIILGFFYRSIEDYHEQSSVMLAVFFFLFLIFPISLNIQRQMIAVAIAFFATRYVFQKRYIKAAVWLLVALSFHYTSLIILPFWFLKGKNRWQRIVRIVLFSLLALVVLGDLLFRSAFQQIPLIGLIAQTTPPEAYLSYGLLLMRLTIIVPVIIFRKKLIEHDERNYYWMILMMFELVFSHFGYIFDVFNRFALYFSVSWVVLLPALVRCMPTRAAQYRMGAYLMVAAIGLWIYNVAIQNYGDVLPYKNIFDAYFSGML